MKSVPAVLSVLDFVLRSHEHDAAAAAAAAPVATDTAAVMAWPVYACAVVDQRQQQMVAAAGANTSAVDAATKTGAQQACEVVRVAAEICLACGDGNAAAQLLGWLVGGHVLRRRSTSRSHCCRR